MAETGSAPNRVLKDGLKWTLRLVLSLALLLLLFRQEETRKALASLDAGTVPVIAGCVVYYIACQMINTWKWSLVLLAMGYRVPYLCLLRITFIGMFSNFFLPTSVGGDVVRAGLMRRHEVPLSIAALSVFVQRFTGMTAMLVIGFAGALLAGAERGAPRQVLPVMALLLLAVLASAAVGTIVEQRFSLARKLPKKIGGPLQRIGDGVLRLAKAPGLMIAVMALSFLFQLLLVGLNAWLGQPVNIELDAPHWLWVVPVTTLGGMIPFALGGLGVREWVATWVMGPLGYKDAASTWSLLWQAMVVFASLPGAALWFFGGRHAAPGETEE